jgi:tellurite resistance-related uncharacterized protein
MTAARISRSLPSGLELYKTSPVFTTQTIPESLLTAHTTKPGVWGLLRVQRGRLLYCLDANSRQQLTLEQGATAVIETGVPHHVELLDADTASLLNFTARSRGYDVASRHQRHRRPEGTKLVQMRGRVAFANPKVKFRDAGRLLVDLFCARQA